MKVIVCANSGDIHLISFSTSWTRCQCGNTAVRWIDPNQGTVVVAARRREYVRLLGLNNNYLIPMLQRDVDLKWEDYRSLHDEATSAPLHVFDKSRAGCWAVLMRIGRSSDVRWATPEEHEEAFRETK